MAAKEKYIWQRHLAEHGRVLDPGGLFMVGDGKGWTKEFEEQRGQEGMIRGQRALRFKWCV